MSEANLYELWGKGIHVHYSATSISGKPLLTYEGYGSKHSYQGDEIRVADTELGRQVTITLAVVPDLKTDTFTFLIPPVNLAADRAARFTSVGVHATHLTSIAGPAMIKGAQTSYDGTDLHGIARHVDF